MAHVVKLDALNLHDGTNYECQRPTFAQPPKQTQVQPYMQDHGGVVIEGSDYYGTVTHRIVVECIGTTIDNLMANIRALQAKVVKRDTVLEYQFDGATNTNYADVLYAYCDDPYQSDRWDSWIANGKRVPVTVYLVCAPGWRGALVTSAATVSAKSPVEVDFTPSGTLETPLRVWVDPEDPTPGTYQRYHLGSAISSTSLIHEETTYGSSQVDASCHGGSFRRLLVTNLGYKVLAHKAIDFTALSGRFRVMARMRTDDPSPTAVSVVVGVCSGVDADGHADPAAVVKPFTDGNWTLADLGVVDLPPTALTESFATTATDGLRVWVEPDSLGTNTDFDFMVLLPAESTFSAHVGLVTTTAALLFDGIADLHISEVTTSGGYDEFVRWPGGPMATAVGCPLTAKPGSTNRVVLLSYPDASPNALHSVTLRYAYYPRNLSPVR